MQKMLSHSSETFNCTDESVKEYCSLLTAAGDDRDSFVVKNEIRHSMLNLAHESHHSPSRPNRRTQDMSDALNHSPYLLKFIRQQFYSSLRAHYHESIMGGKIERQSYSAHSLINSLDKALDFLGEELTDWAFVEKDLQIPQWQLVLAKAVDQLAK